MWKNVAGSDRVVDLKAVMCDQVNEETGEVRQKLVGSELASDGKMYNLRTSTIEGKVVAWFQVSRLSKLL